MLKIIPPTTNCGCGYFKSKCAEIHYQKAVFSILCIFCGMKTFDYQDFVEHFRRLHFDDFSNVMESTTEPVVTPLYENKSAHHDPLEFGDREATADPEHVLKQLKEERLEVKAVKIEYSEKESVNAIAKVQYVDGGSEIDANSRNVSPISCASRATVHFDDFNDSDNEYIICEVKVEQSDLEASNTSKARELNPRKNKQELKCISKNFEDEEEENYVYPLLINAGATIELERELATKNTEHDEGDYDNDNVNNTKHGEGHEDIDWSKPFDPNLLKNHEKRPYKPRNKPNLCTYCGRTFKRRYQLETHLNVHTGEKPHQCEICGRLFRAITTLTRHLNTHEQRQMFYCKFCKKAFTHKVALLSHELRHTQERKVPCDECDKWFYTANQMDTHKRKVHNKSDQDDLPFVCDICSKRYRSGSMLSTHKFKKHYKTAKFSCEQCGKKFVSEQQLHSHKHIHVNKE